MKKVELSWILKIYVMPRTLYCLYIFVASAAAVFIHVKCWIAIITIQTLHVDENILCTGRVNSFARIRQRSQQMFPGHTGSRIRVRSSVVQSQKTVIVPFSVRSYCLLALCNAAFIITSRRLFFAWIIKRSITRWGERTEWLSAGRMQGR